jgi:hypothetical protein
MTEPFTILPLSGRPYFSRLTSFTTNTGLNDIPKNYPLIAFTPGYALQAAELNETQEQFYIQQTLTQDLFKNWPLTGESDGDLKFPMWDGAVPLNPNQVTFTSSTLTVNPGWYLIGGVNFFGGIKFWIYNSFALTTTVSNNNTVGLNITSEFINCSSNEADEGFAFTDNSAGFRNANSCGAHRYKISITSVLQVATQVSYPICKVSTLGVCSYLNNLIIG